MASRLQPSIPWRSAGALLPGLVLLLTGVAACSSSSGEARRPAAGTRISTTTISGLGPTTTLRTVGDIAVFGDTVPYTAGRLWPHLTEVYGELGIEPDIVDPDRTWCPSRSPGSTAGSAASASRGTCAAAGG